MDTVVERARVGDEHASVTGHTDLPWYFCQPGAGRAGDHWLLKVLFLATVLAAASTFAEAVGGSAASKEIPSQ